MHIYLYHTIQRLDVLLCAPVLYWYTPSQSNYPLRIHTMLLQACPTLVILLVELLSAPLQACCAIRCTHFYTTSRMPIASQTVRCASVLRHF